MEKNVYDSIMKQEKFDSGEDFIKEEKLDYFDSDNNEDISQNNIFQKDSLRKNGREQDMCSKQSDSKKSLHAEIVKVRNKVEHKIVDLNDEIVKSEEFVVKREMQSSPVEDLNEEIHSENENNLRKKCRYKKKRCKTKAVKKSHSNNNEGTSSISATNFCSSGKIKRNSDEITEMLANSDADDISDDEDILDPEFWPILSESMSDESELDEETNSAGINIKELSIDPSFRNMHSARKKVNRVYWSCIDKRENLPACPTFVATSNPQDSESVSLLPLDYFRQFVSEHLLDQIVAQSNLYAIQCNTNKPLNLSRNELEQWLGVSMNMSMSKINQTRLNWSADTLNETVSSIMSRQRWEDIKKNLHFVDNNTIDNNDKIAKVRLLIDHLRKEFRKIPMTEHLCVDERFVPFKEGSSMKQYIPKKPHKLGNKMFILADSQGMVYDFFPHTGQILPLEQATIPDLCPSSNFVLQFAQAIPENRNHKLYIDNSFTSLPLIQHLASRGIWVCGTVQARRLPCLQLKSDKELSSRGRGSYDEHDGKIKDTTITVVKWYNNQSVCLASSFATSAPVQICTRFDRKSKTYIDVPIPYIVRTYNEHMGGKHFHDQIMSYYRMSFRSKKYYMRLIFYLFDMVVGNCWLLYRRSATRQNIKPKMQQSLCEFKLKLSKSLMMSGKDVHKKRSRTSEDSVESDFEQKKKRGNATRPLPTQDIRKDAIGHYPTIRDKRGACKLPGCKGKIVMFCIKCQVHLCCEKSRNCFLDFHQN